MLIDGELVDGPDVPFGGYKQSGVGRQNGFAGLHQYVETKALAFPKA
jgi:aldehyde dehydrogenase (NAD+)